MKIRKSQNFQSNKMKTHNFHMKNHSRNQKFIANLLNPLSIKFSPKQSYYFARLNGFNYVSNINA